MSKVLEIYNTDDILIRNVIAGVLSILNNNINYDQVWNKDIIEHISLPWFFDMGNSSSERFLQDNFTYFGEQCFKKIEGNFDMFPRGMISYLSTSIDSTNITNRFVEGKYSKFENGKMTTYSSFLYSIPLTLRLKAEIWVDTFGNALKIEQAIREALYRNKTFYVMFRGLKIGCCMGMPDDYNLEKTTEYSSLSENGEQKQKINFDIVVETYQPVFDRTMEVPSDCVMNGIGFDIKYNNDIETEKIELICDEVMVAGLTTHIKWNYNSNNSDMNTINLEYAKIKDEDGNDIEQIEYKPIEMALANQSDYYWNIPKELALTNVKYNIIFNETEKVKVVKEPIIKVLPINGKITNNSFIVLYPGYFLVENDNSEGISNISISLSYKKNSKFTKIKNFGLLNLVWNKVDEKNPITLNKEIDFENIKTKYSLKITNSTNSKVFDIKNDIIIL